MLKKDLAAALGISASMVTRLSRQGMPVDSVAAARTWRERNLETARRKEYRAPSVRRASVPQPVAHDAGAEPLARVAALAAVAERLLPLGQLSVVEADLRAALRAVPVEHRHRVRFSVPPGTHAPGSLAHALQADEQDETDAVEDPAEVVVSVVLWEALFSDVLAVVRAEQERLGPPPPMSEEECDRMGAFWYAAAAGEVEVA